MFETAGPFGAESLPPGYGGTQGTAQQGDIWSDNTPIRRDDPNVPAGAAPVANWQAPWDYSNNPNGAGFVSGGAFGVPRVDTFWEGGAVRSAADAKRAVAQAFVIDGQAADASGVLQWSTGSIPAVFAQGKSMVSGARAKDYITKIAYEYAKNVEGWNGSKAAVTPSAKTVVSDSPNSTGKLAQILQAVGAGIGSGLAANKSAQQIPTAQAVPVSFVDSGVATPAVKSESEIPWALIAAGVGVLVVGGVAAFALSRGGKNKSNPRSSRKDRIASFLKRLKPKKAKKNTYRRKSRKSRKGRKGRRRK